MRRHFLRAKLHRARVTQRELSYDGSLTVDRELIDAAGMLPYEFVQVYNINNGARFETYLITGERGAGEICVNGAAARLAEVGDRIIIVATCWLEPDEIEGHTPKVLLLDDANRVEG